MLFRFSQRAFRLAVLAIPCLIAAPLAAQAADSFSVSAAQMQSLGVQLQRIDKSGASLGQSYSARVVLAAGQEQIASAPLSGVIDQLLVAENDVVKIGQPLMRIASPELGELQLKLMEADASSRLSQRTLKRERELFSEGIIPERRVQEAEAAASQDAARKRQAEAALRLAGWDSSKFQGVLGWSSVGQYKAEVKKADDTYGPIYDKYLKMDLKAVAADKEANEMGKRLFLTYCSQCHGSDARGSKGFPNLADADWQWGGEADTVKTTILEGRNGVMPPHAQLGDETIKNLANFVRSLSGLPHDAVLAAKGKEAFGTVGCTGCHGPEATGTPALGAPNLTDKVWLYGSSEATITETIKNGRNNRMPAWKDFLGEGKVHILAAYVLSLSGAEKK